MVYYCLWCEQKPKLWFSNWCETCRQQKNLNNVYGFERTLAIMKKCCIRDESQLENKIKVHKSSLEKNGNDEVDYEKPITRSKNNNN